MGTQKLIVGYKQQQHTRKAILLAVSKGYFFYKDTDAPRWIEMNIGYIIDKGTTFHGRTTDLTSYLQSLRQQFWIYWLEKVESKLKRYHILLSPEGIYSPTAFNVWALSPVYEYRNKELRIQIALGLRRSTDRTIECLRAIYECND